MKSVVVAVVIVAAYVPGIYAEPNSTQPTAAAQPLTGSDIHAHLAAIEEHLDALATVDNITDVEATNELLAMGGTYQCHACMRVARHVIAGGSLVGCGGALPAVPARPGQLGLQCDL